MNSIILGVSEMAFLVLLHVLLLAVGFLFILDFPLPKPGLKEILILVAVMGVTVAIVMLFTRFNLPHHLDETNRIVEELIEGLLCK